MRKKQKSQRYNIPLKVKKSGNRPSSSYSNSCSPALNPCTIDKKVNGNGDYYALVVQRNDYTWSFVRVYDCYLDITHSYPHVFHISSLEYLMELWERVVIHNAIPWNDAVYPDTMRIISYKLIVEDRTIDLCKKVRNENYDEVLVKTALSKLTDAEIKALKLNNNVVINKLFHNPNFDSHDSRLLKELSDENYLVDLNESLKTMLEEN